ncbi:MAG: M48 family metallopeptidase [Actinomycetota bacterium]|nr:M48 family metallopeptidase [Actinomycetota bacterium]
MEVEVVRSPRRRKTVQASKRDGVLRVCIPASMTKAEEDKWVREMVRRVERRQPKREATDLQARANVVASRYGLPAPARVRWVDNQRSRWASCTPLDGAIRLSSRAAGYPEWVVDYLLVHELAHLAEAGHGAAFWALVNRYPKTERARGFLIAKGLEDDS